MALLTLTTNLKSLRYGRDRKDGGDSGQPYIQTPIPGEVLDEADALGPDFLLRGGILTPSRSIQDVSRLTKMFADTKSPAGILFTAKQNLLSRIGVETVPRFIFNEGAYLPTSTLLQAAGNAFGVHLNKQGIDPTGIFNFLDPLGLPMYERYTRRNRNPGLNPKRERSKIKDLLNDKLDSNDTTLFSYGGGPNSILGIGRTRIKRVENTSLASGGSKTYKSYPQFQKYNYVTWDYSLIANQHTSLNTDSIIKQDFRKYLSPPNANNSNIPSVIVNYTDKNIEKRVNLGDPGKRGNKSNYTKGKNGSNMPLDKINAMPLYRSNHATLSPIKNDLVKFRIGVIDNDEPSKKTYIHFRAFLDNMDDNYSAQWNDVSYMGRGEKFYRYNGFDRQINLGWTVAAQSRGELIPMYQKLNYLASVLTPDFSDRGYMRGNLVTLTVGGYLSEQTGIITSLNYGVPQESPWEIAIPTTFDKSKLADGVFSTNDVKEMPHMIKVTGFTFIPIHEFTPRVQQNKFSEEKISWGGAEVDNAENWISAFGPERYIQLRNSVHMGKDNVVLDNYGNPDGSESSIPNVGKGGNSRINRNYIPGTDAKSGYFSLGGNPDLKTEGEIKKEIDKETSDLDNAINLLYPSEQPFNPLDMTSDIDTSELA